MNLRGYGAFATGILASVFGFDFLWTLTQLDAFEAFFLAMFIGFVAVVVYALATEPKSRRRGGDDRDHTQDAGSGRERPDVSGRVQSAGG